MAEITTLLCAVDLSPASRQAAATAARLAKAMGARLVLLHVLEQVPVAMPNVGDPSAASSPFESERAAYERLSALAVQFGAELGIEVEPRLAKGGVLAMILGVARETGADLIVLGRSNRLPWPHVNQLGSVAERVTRTAAVPVVVCGGEATNVRPEVREPVRALTGAQGRGANQMGESNRAAVA